MKIMKIHSLLLVLALLLSACGEPTQSVEDVIASGDLEQIRALRSELKTEEMELVTKLESLDAKIDELGIEYLYLQFVSLTGKILGKGIPADHWVHDQEQGGGRIIGEGCHFVDLLRFLAGSPISGVNAVMMGSAPGLLIRDDKVSITLEFEDGSFGTINYLANGHRSYPKERLEVFCAGGVIEHE